MGLHRSWRWSKMSARCQYWTYVRRKEGESMLPEWLITLLVLLQEAWSTRRDAHIRFFSSRWRCSSRVYPATGSSSTRSNVGG